MMEIRKFGLNKKGEPANLYMFKNEQGMEMQVSDFGATLHALLIPDKDGKRRDVVLGYDDPIQYESGSRPFFGATVGRNANRLGKAAYEYKGNLIQLENNDGANNLHSGWDCWSFRIWQVKQTTDNSITFVMESPDGDQGFPGAVHAEVTYTLTADSVEIAYEACPESDTPINMTNHSYFNLNGHDAGSVRGQQMWIHADAYTETDAELIPTGRIISVNGTPMDFRERKLIGRDINADYEAIRHGKGYDHNWVLNHAGQYEIAAELASSESGIVMEVYTDLPGIQVYSGNGLAAEPGKGGAVYEKHQGICFETQHFPDAPNHPAFPSSICRKGEMYRSRTAYRFFVKDVPGK